MTPEILVKATGCAMVRANMWADPISAAMALYAIDSPARQAAFLAQTAHESGKFVYVRELWGPTDAQLRYDGRGDLGNTTLGDGYKYRGRGLIQITGRANYKKMGEALGLDLVNHPDLLEVLSNAALSAAQFWTDHELNELADVGDFETITRRINGGLNGYDDRCKILDMAKTALGA